MQTPNAKKWIEDCRQLKTLAADLNRVRNLVEAYSVLQLIDHTVDRLAGLCRFPGFPGSPLSQREVKKYLISQMQVRDADADLSILKESFGLRQIYGEVRDCILSFATHTGKFTVDDLIAKAPISAPRRVWSASLYSLATKGSKPLKRVKAGERGRGSESPAVYMLRR